MTPELKTLGPLRFQCLACGSCCHGVKVELLSDDEAARIERVAAEMGVEDAVRDGWLVQEGGKCKFLDADNRCGIHARYGADVKPALCRQFPYVIVDTETGLRGGIDPSSFNILATWDTAPEVDDFHGEARQSRLDPHNVRVEAAVLAWCSEPGATVASVLGKLCGNPGGVPDLPPGFADRLAARLQRMHLGFILSAKDGGPAHRAALQPLVDRIETLDTDPPPAWPVLEPEVDAYALEVARRMVYLRLATRIPLVQGVALLMLCGAVGIAWACPDRARYGPALAAWSRLLRGGTFWQSLTPDPPTMQWLASGQGAPAGG